MDNLSDVGSCLRSLQSTKVTERKKAASRLGDLLTVDQVIHTLNENSQNGKGIYWTVVFDAVKAYVELEIDALQNAKESQSSTTLANRGRKKQEVLSLYKTVIRKSSEKKPYLQSEDLLESILDWLKDDYKLKSFGASLTNLLLKDVLRVRKYWLDISSEHWKKLLLLHCHLYLTDEFDRSLLAQAIHEIVTGNMRQGDLQPQKILLFFAKALEILKSESKGTYHILSALNVFHWSIAGNCRLQLCHFGEENMNFLLSIWGNSGNDRIKEELVDLLHLQMVVHHPCGMSVEQDGAMAHSWTEWKRHLKNLHDSLVTDIDNTTKRTYFQGGSRGLTLLSPSYINLAAEVFKQLPPCILTSPDTSDDSGSHQVTDIGDNGTPVKRLRLSHEDKTLVGFVMENSNKTQAIPWLQILTSLLTKYPTILTREDLLRVLQKMLVVLKECTRSQLFEHIFKVLSALAICFQHGTTKESEQSRDVWQSVWTTCLNTVISRQAQSEGYQSHGFLLMATIMEAKLVLPGRDIWNIFLLNFCKPTPASCSLLGSVINHKGLDERYCPSMLGRVDDPSSQSQFPLRQLLLEWLLSETRLNESQVTDLKSPSEKISLLCLCLIHQDSRAVLQSRSLAFSPHSGVDGVSVKNYPAPSREIKSRADIDLPTPRSLQEPNLESLFLRTTFGENKVIKHEEKISMIKSAPCLKKVNLCNPMLGILVKNLNDILERAASSFADLVDPNVHHIHYLVWFSTLISRLLYHLNSDNEGSSTLCRVLRNSMEKFGFLFVSHVQANGIPGLQPVLKSLLPLMDFGTLRDDKGSDWVVKFMRSCIDCNFVDMMINLASGKAQRSASIKESSLGRRNRYGGRISSHVFSRSQRNSQEDFINNDTLNLEFESDMETDDFDAGEGSNSNMGDSSQSSSMIVASNDVSDFLSPCSLKEVDQVRLLSVKWLCLFGSPDSAQTSDLQLPGLEVDTVDIQRQLFQLISNEQFQPNKPVDLLILLTMAYQFLHQNQNTKTSAFKEILVALRHTAKEHFKDQEICCRLLFHLQNIVPQLVRQNNVDESDAVVPCRNMLVKFVKHFGMMYNKSTDRVRIEYNKILLDLIKHDPNGTWGFVGSECEDDPQGSDDARSASQLFLSHLKDSDAGVRMMIATELKWLLIKCTSNGSCEKLSKEEQLSVLKNVLRTFDEVLDRQNSQKSKNPRHRQDEMESYIAVCLQGIATIIINSAVCEKECLLWVCATVAEREISHQIVVKMLSTICVKLQFLDVKSYLKCHLPFLIFHWFERLGKILQKFPFKIMDYNSLPEFLRSHQQVIVSRLFISTSSMSDIKQFMDLIQVDLHQAILSCLPHILVSILPVYVQQSALCEQSADEPRISSAVGQGSAGILKRFKKVSKRYEALKSELSQEEINDSVYNRLCEIAILLISSLQVGGGNQLLLIPDPNPPYYTQSEVEDTLDYIAKTLSGSSQRSDQSSSLVSLLAKIPRGLHSVLTGLYTAISKEHRSHELLRLVQMYQLFIKIVMKEFHTGLEDNWAAVLREIMCRLLILLSNGLPDDGMNQRNEFSPSEMGHDLQEEIFLTLLDILSLVFISCLEICPDEMVNYLLRVVDLLASLASKQGTISRVAVELLENIIIKAKEQEEHLEYVLLLVNPLPDVPSLAKVKSHLVDFAGNDSKTLAQRFKSLTDVCELPNENQSEGLALRLQSLATFVLRHQDELDNMLLLPEGLACVSQAISQILHLSASPCHEVAKAATLLLGTIGPLELGTLSFPTLCAKTPYYLAMEIYKEDEFEKDCWLLHFLDTCLLDPCAEIVSVAGDILKSTLSAQHILKFKESYQKEMRDQGFLFNYLHPFHFGYQKTSMAPPPKPAPVDRGIIDMVDQTDLWSPRSPELTHENWITSLVCRILSSGAVTNEALSKITPMCQLKVQINEEALPYLIHTILQGDDTERWRECLSRHFRAFFQKHCQDMASLATGSSPVYLKKQSVRTMLSVVQHLRRQNKRPVRGRQPAPTPWDNNFWLDLDYLDIARAAHFCHANFSALLFIEIWWDVARHDSNMNLPNISGGYSSHRSSDNHLNEISPAEGHFGNDVQALLLNIHSGVGDPDALYGCGAGKKSDPHCRVLTYLQEYDQAKALTTLDIEASGSKTSIPLCLLKTIQACGADNLLQKCLEGFDQNYFGGCTDSVNISLEEFRYETAWKLGQWDFDLPSSYDETSSLPYHKAVYHTLSSIREKHLDVASCIIEAARRTCQANFDLKAESCKELYSFLSQLQSLGLLQEVISGLKNSDETWQSIVSGYMEGTCDDSLHYSKTVNFECVLSQLELITSLAQVLGTAGIAESISLRLRALWGLAVCARQAKRFQLAEKTVHTLKSEVREVDQRMIPGITIERADMEEAKLFWARSEVKIALDVLKNLIGAMNKNKGQGNWPLLPKALSTYGSWLAATRLETPTVILSSYLEKSVELVEEPCQDDKALAVECFLALAQYADAKYQHISDYLKSPDYKDKMDLLQDVKGLLSVAEDMKDSSKYLKTMERNASIDEEEIQSINQDHLQVLKQALLNYIRVLKYGSDHDVKVFRAVALWFENAEDDDVNEMIQESVTEIASYKFLPLYYQLAARMTVDGGMSDFQTILSQLMERVSREHPHHTLWIIMALAHANKDDELTTKGGAGRRASKVASHLEQITEEGRMQAAKQMLDRLKETGDSPSLHEVIRKMEVVSTAYIELANWNVSDRKNERKPFTIDQKLQITKLRDVTGILLPTVDLKVEPSGDYSKLVYPVKFHPAIRLVGGVNLPKVFTCTGSDGKERIQLVKGRDDLRQDAVMQQVFSLVNQVLAADPETRKRHLSIRTYKVVPLSQKSGLLEWCLGTQPIGEYLTGTRSCEGAHVRYRPKDWKPLECRAHLHKNRDKDRMKAYQEICANFKPVFRHFFMEKFKDPPEWFEKRLAYTRSVATNSIVGYIMGLGDRHVQNILVDRNTAELVHIDLGIAFEMGRILPTPETVPFRLTRDIVDGMGITGVEGVFRRCCEKTMQVLRNNSESLLTIVQVLVYDPLSHWSLSPHQVLAIQKKRERAGLDSLESTIQSSGSVPLSGQVRNSGQASMMENGEKSGAKDDKNKMAERTLLRLKEKLSGVEDGSQLGVDGQVNSLIQQASDPKNLCRLFAGWQPYL